ncbi:integration host factor, actinobacterial type [Thermoleophilum album]|uniref:Integration host factor-like helix-two turn-helix domain-containing protein n=1 Tax=Thermoleophilum album TaxID=29539 RepID=A0A1H6FU20_THEAL|nr:integration host factor, actinobacterial type [Thermoleophilum album]SEH14316.1 hypothetical protein SAMN02745716_1596 [Thermoleophilum album]
MLVPRRTLAEPLSGAGTSQTGDQPKDRSVANADCGGSLDVADGDPCPRTLEDVGDNPVRATASGGVGDRLEAAAREDRQAPAAAQDGRRNAAAPERSLAQRMEALRRANEIRTRRARLKRDLKAGRVRIDELLLDPPDYVLTAKVFDLLLAVPKFGRVKVNRALTHCRISPSKTIGGLSERQRNELVAYLRR